MTFDPEEVERWDSDGSPMVSSSESSAFANGRFVLASAYDQLLELYRESQIQIDNLYTQILETMERD